MNIKTVLKYFAIAFTAPVIIILFTGLMIYLTPPSEVIESGESNVEFIPDDFNAFEASLKLDGHINDSILQQKVILNNEVMK